MTGIEDHWNHVVEFMGRALKLKKHMLARGLTKACTKCKINGCDGMLHVRITAHRNKHCRAWCSKCSLSMME